MTTDHIVKQIAALRDHTASTGMITKRAQNALLMNLPDAKLLQVATKLQPILRNEKSLNEGMNVNGFASPNPSAR